ncbi:MAG: branched-chain amino acid ABC transporter permease LivH [Deltaproteobacteria bacterium]|jgi:branched-chain amino acid transport system permease protein|nr:branched-chain amino acid ABC transporter permease LivH [Deltaproteobacteria bacterium]
MNLFVELCFSGLTKGSIYALIALGYTMVYGIIALINFAHGEIYMIGAFTALIFSLILSSWGFSGLGLIFSVMVIAGLYAAMYGYTTEKIAYKPLRSSPRLSPLISAIGLSIFLQNYVLLAQTSNDILFPDLIGQLDFLGFLEPIAHLATPTQICIVITCAVTMAVLSFIIKKTKMGLAMRAVAQNPDMARLSGVNIDRVISGTFILGSVLAALGGLLIGCSMQQINSNIGFLAGLKAFTAAVLGGIGSIPGAVLGALILGFAENFTAGYLASDYEDVVAFILLTAILIIRPEGILGQPISRKV